MTKQSITIKTYLGELNVTAEVAGPFAIHRTAGVDDGTYSITHVPTGFSFPMSCRSRSFARCFVSLLNKQPVNWDIKDPHEFVEIFTKFCK